MPTIYNSSFSYTQGSFLSSTGPGPQSVTGLGFAPTFILFFGVGREDGTDLAVQNDGQSFVGAASIRSGTIKQWCTSHWEKTAVNPQVGSSSNVSTACIRVVKSSVPAFAIDGAMQSFDSNGFTINWTTVDALPRRINYYAISAPSGVDISCGTFTNTSGVGSQSIAGVGFKPDALIFKHDFTSGTIHDDVGCAINGVGAWALSMFSANASPTNTAEIYDNARRCIMNWGNGATQCEIEVTSYDADGFTINKITQDTVLRPYNFIAIRGVSMSCGTMVSRGGGGQSRSVTGLSFAPLGVMIVGSQMGSTVAAMAQTRGVSRSYAFALSAGQQAVGAYEDGDGLVTSKNCHYWSSSHVHAITNSASLVQRGALTSLNADGFTITWDTSDGIPRQMFYIAFGPIQSSGSSFIRPTQMEISPSKTAYLIVPHTTSGLASSAWTIYLFKDGDRVTDTPVDVRENPTGIYTFSFSVDSTDESQWTLVVYQTSAPSTKYTEQWRVKKKIVETNVKQIRSRMDSDGGYFQASEDK